VLCIHTRDGRTHNVALDDRDKARDYLTRLQDQTFQESITGLTILHRGVSYSMSRPRGFDAVCFSAERIKPVAERKIKGGERIILQAGDVRASVTVHMDHRAARVTLMKIGRQRYVPPIDNERI
jgi:hypothetical protein